MGRRGRQGRGRAGPRGQTCCATHRPPNHRWRSSKRAGGSREQGRVRGVCQIACRVARFPDRNPQVRQPSGVWGGGLSPEQGPSLGPAHARCCRCRTARRLVVGSQPASAATPGSAVAGAAVAAPALARRCGCTKGPTAEVGSLASGALASGGRDSTGTPPSGLAREVAWAKRQAPRLHFPRAQSRHATRAGVGGEGGHSACSLGSSPGGRS